MVEKLKQFFLGRRKDPLDPRVFHNLSLAAFFAWVGLGADGLSSSSYGPEEAFLSLAGHSHLALYLAFAVLFTIFILSASYSQIIELFPAGGGGYVVSTKLVGPRLGLVSGCALLVDYVLTIAISVASSMDAIFSFLPPSFLEWKFTAALFFLLVLIILNLRGVKESVIVLTPIFLAFVVTHVWIITYGIATHGDGLPKLFTGAVAETRTGISELGFFGMGVILMRAFCLGGGTFTGIEAVSNGLDILREPRVATAKKTMRYMAISLSVTAVGLIVNYLLNDIHHVPGQTLNATLVHQLTSNWSNGHWFFLLTMISEGALLLVAAQTGFLGGPRVMSRMAVDRWLPTRFMNLSERLVMKDGILVMGLSAFAALLYTHASVKVLVVMYSINVFVTFTLSQFGMVRHWWSNRRGEWLQGLAINGTGLLLTSAILSVTTILKFREGGWVTILVTGALIALCFAIKRHYADTLHSLRDLNRILGGLPIKEGTETRIPEKKPDAPTAVLMVGGYNGIGIHSILAIQRFFPGHFKNFVFLSVGIIDSDHFKGRSEIDALMRSVEQDLAKYVRLAQSYGFYAESKASLGTDVIEALELMCQQTGDRWSKKVFFMGQLAFEGETFWSRLLHNQTSFVLHRRLLFHGLAAVILPIRLPEPNLDLLKN